MAACWEFIIPGRGMEIPNIGALPFANSVDSVIREMHEETGLTVKNPNLVGTKSWMMNDGGRYLVLLYTATEYEGELHSSEEGDIAWMTIDEMKAGKMVEGMELYFRVYLDRDVNEIWYERDGDGWIEMLK